LLFLAPFYTKILKNIKKILIVIQRSNGDVFLSSNLIYSLFKNFDSPKIDLLVNDDTFLTANLLPHVNFIHQFSYEKKKNNRWVQERFLIKKIYRKYDLSINLTASDRSVIYALLASKKSISAIEKNKKKSWWKKLLLFDSYYFESDRHILLNNSEPLNLLDLKHSNIQRSITISSEVSLNLRKKLSDLGIKEFIIFHPTAQYEYKIYPSQLRDKLLKKLSKLHVPILITGGTNLIDSTIKKEIPQLHNVYNFIGETSLEEYFALSKLSMAYVGMDTLNMHIAASQNKPIFAIFGPTNVKMWSPWSNILEHATNQNKPVQSYGNITLFQSSLPCNSCGKIGCGSNHNKDEFSYNILPEAIFREVYNWYQKNSNIKPS
jgi:heptosyltransferase III